MVYPLGPQEVARLKEGAVEVLATRCYETAEVVGQVGGPSFRGEGGLAVREACGVQKAQNRLHMTKTLRLGRATQCLRKHIELRLKRDIAGKGRSLSPIPTIHSGSTARPLTARRNSRRSERYKLRVDDIVDALGRLKIGQLAAAGVHCSLPTFCFRSA